MMEQQLILERLARIEAKLDTLLQALAESDEDEPSITLDGDIVGAERDRTQSLG